MRVDEAGDDRRVLEVRRRPSRRDLDDLAVLEADAAAGDRRPVDGQHPVGGELGHSTAVVTVSGRQRRSKKPETASEIR